MVDETCKSPATTIVKRSQTAATAKVATHSGLQFTDPSKSLDIEETESPPLPVRDPPEFIDILGSGGMAVVHISHDKILRRDVAVKLLHGHLEADSKDAETLLREARITASLQHPNIVPIHEIARTTEGRPYFTMQAVEGRNLRQWWSHPHRQPGSISRMSQGIKILIRVCEALEYAHAQGVLHQDVKPDNIMVGPFGRVYLMDWGLATSRDFPKSKANQKEIAGTPAYMSPEQANGEQVDERSDVFGIGSVLFELISGETPYGSLESSSLARSAEGKVKSVAEATIELSIPRSLFSLINRATQAKAADRYATVSELRHALESYLRDGLHLPHRIFSKEDFIVRQGERGRCAYLILSGSCEAYLETEGGGKKVLRIMNSGDIFGELALLLEGNRTATVQALETTEVLIIDLSVLEKSGMMQGWTSQLLKQLAQRFSEKMV